MTYGYSSTGPVITHCPHGLDMRLHPRCYLCTPLPPMSAGSTGPACQCPVNWQSAEHPYCPLHHPGNPVAEYLRSLVVTP